MNPIRLPWPHRDLSPNARVHWARKSRAVRKARHDAKIACLAAGVRGLDWDCARVSIIFHAPDDRARDLDNMVASLKGALDGIADVTGIDDSKWSFVIRRGEPVKGGEVEILLSEIKAIGVGDPDADGDWGGSTSSAPLAQPMAMGGE